MEEISVCIVDDISELRNALAEIINMSQGFICLGAFATAESALQQIPSIKPDVVLMDINLNGDTSGIDCVRELKQKLPETNFMMCTVYEDNEKIFDALSAGASGYILKKTAPDKLLEAIKELHEGGAPMSSQIARKVVSTFQNKPSTIKTGEQNQMEVLTKREIEVLEQLSKGMMYKEIAAMLNISTETVRRHLYHVYEKLHVTNRIEAINKYYGR